MEQHKGGIVSQSELIVDKGYCIRSSNPIEGEVVGASELTVNLGNPIEHDEMEFKKSFMSPKAHTEVSAIQKPIGLQSSSAPPEMTSSSTPGSSASNPITLDDDE